MMNFKFSITLYIFFVTCNFIYEASYLGYKKSYFRLFPLFTARVGYMFFDLGIVETDKQCMSSNFQRIHVQYFVCSCTLTLHKPSQ